MSTILISIKPEYVNRIISGTKTFEYRKHIPHKSVEKIVIYSTNPVKKVVGEAVVLNILEMSPSKLWEQTKKDAGVSRSKYRIYFKGSKTAFAFHLGQVKLYNPPKQLSDYDITQAPQSFVYI